MGRNLLLLVLKLVLRARKSTSSSRTPCVAVYRRKEVRVILQPELDSKSRYYCKFQVLLVEMQLQALTVSSSRQVAPDAAVRRRRGDLMDLMTAEK